MIPRIIRPRICSAQSFCLSRNIISTKRVHRSFSSNVSEHEDELEPSGKQTKIRNLLDGSAAFIETSPANNEDMWTTLPYAEGTIMSRKERRELDIERTRIDPRDTSIILFPGQGSQFVGMARSLEHIPAAKDVFNYASEVLNFDILKLCNNGPKAQLNDIRYGHAAIVTTCLASLERLREERPDAVFNCVGTAGFSVGEITALVFAGALQLDEALNLVQIRAEAIHAASEMSKGGMATIFFRADAKIVEACKKAKEWCRQNDVDNPECLISNFIFPRYKALSGSEEALQYLEDNLRKFGIGSMKRVKNTPALHCNLMKPAVEPFAKALQQVHISDPVIRVYSNVNGKPYAHAKQILKQLPQQIAQPLKWEQTMHFLYGRHRGEYFPRTVVCGPGYSLNSILKNVNAKAGRQSVHCGDMKK